MARRKGAAGGLAAGGVAGGGGGRLKISWESVVELGVGEWVGLGRGKVISSWKSGPCFFLGDLR